MLYFGFWKINTITKRTNKMPTIHISKEAWLELTKEKIDAEDKTIADVLDRRLGIKKR